MAFIIVSVPFKITINKPFTCSICSTVFYLFKALVSTQPQEKVVDLFYRKCFLKGRESLEKNENCDLF